jgi:tRNA (guanine37-N1)-methyltransferase
MFQGPFEFSIVKKAREKKLVEINIVNIRDFGIGKHKVVDDTPYGGGIGMVMRADILKKAIENTKYKIQNTKYREKVVLLSASGKSFDQQKANEYARLDHLILICGHYEGVDERITKYIDEEISVGECVYTGGEIPSMLITDAVTRLVPGVLKAGATDNESFSIVGDAGEICLEYPQYTKPTIFDNTPVPEILLSGNHKKIQDWRLQEASKKTKRVRPDLLKSK